MEIEISLPNDVNKICRSCMSISNEMHSIFSKVEIFGHGEFISDMLMACATVQINEDDGLPSVICNPCIQQLNISYTFRRQCEKIESDLREILKAPLEIVLTDTDAINDSKSIFQFILNSDGDVQEKVCYDTQNKNLESCNNLQNVTECVDTYKLNLSDSKKKQPLVCDLCDEPFETSDDLKLHVETHVHEIDFSPKEYEETVTGCNILEETVSNSSEILTTDHVLSAEKKSKQAKIANNVACKLCNKILHSTQDLVLHLATHKQSKTSLTCPLCAKHFKTIRNLNKHIFFHVNNEEKSMNSSITDINQAMANCDICDKHFNDRSQLIGHFLEHTSVFIESKTNIREKNESSPYVDFENRSQEQSDLDVNRVCKFHNNLFENEIKNVSTKSVYKCAICEKSFITRNLLLLHINEHVDKIDERVDYINDQADKINECTEQSVTSKNLESFNEKQRIEPKFLCSLCGHGFQTKSRLTTHVLRHDNKKPFICSVCDKGFSAKAVLKIHERIHMNYKPYVCSYCGYSCCQSGDLQMHIRTHTGEKPYKCPYPNCDRHFTTSSHCKEHMRRHTGERNHKCTVCSKAFTESKTLKTHMLTHTGARPFACEICGKRFRRKHHRAIHMKQHA